MKAKRWLTIALCVAALGTEAVVLEWIGKSKVVNHHLDVPCHVLEKKWSHGGDDSGNMVIKGDNLLALKALLPRYAGKVKCIYIDPPYNTGNEGWCYNDNVNDPTIQRWLNKVVGKEGEDFTRHDKWLCMMYPRLRLLQRLMAHDGVLVISIGYHELHNLVCLCNEIFATRQIVTVTVQTSGGKPSGGFNYVHEYLVFVAPKEFNANTLPFCGGKDRTPFEGLTLSTFNKMNRPNQVYPIFIDDSCNLVGVGKSLQELIDSDEYRGEKGDYVYDYNAAPFGATAVWPFTSKGEECVWRLISKRLIEDWKKGYIKITKMKRANKGKMKNAYSVQYLPEGVIEKIENKQIEVLGREQGHPTLILGENKTVGGQVPTIWNEKEFYTVKGTDALKLIFPEQKKAFDYPKSPSLIRNVIQAISKPGDIVLDSFAGSGTTGQAVLELNSDGGNRNFILVEMSNYAENLTAERVKRVINGYGQGEDAVEGTGGAFSFYELGEPLMVGEELNEKVATEKIREYIYYTEVNKPLPDLGAKAAKEPYLLGVEYDTAYYFCYEKGKVVTLDRELLRSIKTKADQYVIYADKCALSEAELRRRHITFKKIPRDITRL